MKSERTLTCIICPRGCTLTVEHEEGKVYSVSGNICPRGVQYATDECTAPKRTLTSTVRCRDGSLISVKTASQIPKEKIFAAMRQINSTLADNGVKIGDIIIKNVAETGISVVATSENYS